MNSQLTNVSRTFTFTFHTIEELDAMATVFGSRLVSEAFEYFDGMGFKEAILYEQAKLCEFQYVTNVISHPSNTNRKLNVPRRTPSNQVSVQFDNDQVLMEFAAMLDISMLSDMLPEKLQQGLYQTVKPHIDNMNEFEAMFEKLLQRINDNLQVRINNES